MLKTLDWCMKHAFHIKAKTLLARSRNAQGSLAMGTAMLVVSMVRVMRY